MKLSKDVKNKIAESWYTCIFNFIIFYIKNNNKCILIHDLNEITHFKMIHHSQKVFCKKKKV